MSSSTEDLLRELFAADAAAAPEPAALADLVLCRVQRRRRVQVAGVAVAAAVAVGAVLTAGPWQSGPRLVATLPAVTSIATAPSPVPAPVAPPARPGEASGGGSGLADSCVEAYSPAAVAASPFAFDGTVLAIGPARSNRPGVELPLSGVTFSVHRWFRGGTGATVVVDLDDVRTSSRFSEPSLDVVYRVGTRLLVSGAPRWGGRPTDAAIAWSCGFTRSYDPQTAAAWAAATQ